MFVDIAKAKVKAGGGGDDAVSFHWEKYIAAGGPDGGDGGRGGNVVFQVDKSLSTLADFRYKRRHIAEDGQNDAGKQCSGRDTPDLAIRAPQGTLVRDLESSRLLADLPTNEPQIIARGGSDGWGNAHFATPTRQTPRSAKPDQPDGAFDIQLGLKLLTDVGLASFSNVGRSTLVSVMSEAKPSITNYHFTAITPVLGVVFLGGRQSFVMADIPGLIEGAGEGAGLGHQFLRHVERYRLLARIVDVAGSRGRDPKEDFKTVNRELKKFNGELPERPMLVARSECDLAIEEQVGEFRRFVEKQGYEFFLTMAAIRYGVDPLLKRIQEELSRLPPMIRFEPDPVPLLEIIPEQAEKFATTNQDGVFVVEREWLLQLLYSINFDDYKSPQYFQRVLISSGVVDALREAGAEEGDTVSMYDLEFGLVEQGTRFLGRFSERDCDPRQLSPLTLAFVGDGIFGLSMRERLVYQTGCPMSTLHKSAVVQVCCGAQAQAVQKPIPLFIEEEEVVSHRGRNIKVSHVPKNSSPADYRAATALGVLFGCLYSKGELARLRQFFVLICKE